MTPRGRTLAVGAFVLGALVLLLVALIALGSSSLLSDTRHFVVYVEESVSGLEQGSPVKLAGVRVGRVSSLAVALDRESRSTLTVVVCEVSEGDLVDTEGRPLSFAPRALEAMVDEGLRATVQLQGVTGLRYVDLRFLDPGEHPAEVPVGWHVLEEDLPVVPYAPSTLVELAGAIDGILTELEDADLGGTGEELRALMASVRGMIEEAREARLGESLAGAAAAFRTVAEDERTLESVASIGRAADAVEDLARDLEERVDPLSEELLLSLRRAEETLAAVQAAAEGLAAGVAPGGPLSLDAERALERMAEAAEAVERLAEYLERHPDAILRGRSGGPR